MRKIEIFDVDGNLMYQGKAATKREFIVNLIKRKKSLARANLENANLLNANLNGGDFSHCNLNGALMRGATAKKTSFVGASLKGVEASGMTATFANFSDADFSPDPRTGKASNFSGATLTYSLFDNSTLDRCDFSGASMSATSLTSVTAFRAKFTKATMHNTNWADSKITSSDFKDAALAPTNRISDKHRPDRTWGAAIVGNNMNGADIGLGNKGFTIDKRVGASIKALTWGGLTAGFYLSGSYLPLDAPVDFLKGALGTGASFFALASAFAMAHDYIEDIFKDGLFEWIGNLQVKIRRGIAQVIKSGKSLNSIAVGFLSSNHMELVSHAIRDPEKNVYERMKATLSGELEVIICDRNSVAEALTRITDAQVNRHRDDADLVITRIGENDYHPRSVILRKDGTSEMVWKRECGRIDSIKWDKNGDRVTDHRSDPPLVALRPRNKLMDSFIRLIIQDNEFYAIDFDSETHGVRKGKDDSVVIYRRSNGRLDNPNGPIVYTKDDESIWQLGSDVPESEKYDPEDIESRRDRRM